MRKTPDGYVAYPLGLKGIIVGQGDTYEEALPDVKSAIRFHIESFGENILEAESSIVMACWFKDFDLYKMGMMILLVLTLCIMRTFTVKYSSSIRH
ncbi:MAG: type II toxin-antitoxin system HicB family antitoxin [Candidatus Jettenia sp. CY-1]|nr:MAG: type II toxin-antitoxin system HicB family antitoxin [Candidatus Jettenia sp. CY-1]